MKNAGAYVLMLIAAIVGSVFLGSLATYRSVSYYAWLFVLPVVPVGLLVGLAVYHLASWPEELLMRRASFVFVASIVTMLVSGIAAQVFVHAGKSPKPEFVYIPGKDTLEMSAPENVVVDEMFLVTVRRKDGPWQRIRLEDLPKENGFYTESPQPLKSYAPAGVVKLHTDPWGAAVVSASDSDAGEMKVHVRSAEPFTMWIEVGVSKVPLKSNVVTVTPRPKK
jgi:hypothetical protein